SSRDRLVTILVAPFMSCSARLPIYTLVIAAAFADAPPLFGVLSVGGLVIFAMYVLGFTVAITTAWLLKRTVLRSPLPALLLELPMYRAPDAKAVLLQVYERCKIFVQQTGTVILALSVLLWGILTFPHHGFTPTQRAMRLAAIEAQHLPAAAEAEAVAHLEREEQTLVLENSLGGRLGRGIEPAIAPLGFDWRIGIGLVASFAAREVLVSTLGQVYALDADTPPDSPALRDAIRADVDPATGRPRFTPLVGVSLMVFFVLAMQCLSTVATVRRETGSWRWPLFQLVYMNTLAYAASYLVYQGGRALGWA
ncbi:MAG TPA: nucleoside recognition domain-containing protein, partial [Myxococcota bacterium]|nr:nucleoside recognition domain-containing protein [Myxococcota bacterium]